MMLAGGWPDVATAADDGVVILNEASRYPEGPLVADGGLYYAEMGSDRVLFTGEGGTRMVWGAQGCLPTSISEYGDGFVVLCHRPGVLVVLSRDGEVRATIDHDVHGEPFPTPNASIHNARGGVYFSSSGPFGPGAPAVGAVMYLDAEGAVRKLADGIHYANGVALTADGRTLYVSEHLGRRILAYPVASDGTLGEVVEVVRLDDLVGTDAARGWEVGPDGLAVDRAGNIYVAEYGAGRLHVIGPDGRLVTTIPVPESHVTAPVLSPDEATLYVTAPASTRPQRLGKVYAIPNPVTNRN